MQEAIGRMLEQAPRRVISVGGPKVLQQALTLAQQFAAHAPQWPMVAQDYTWQPGTAARGHVAMPGGSHNLTRHLSTPNLREDRRMMLAAKVAAGIVNPYLHEQIREKGGAYGAGLSADNHAIRLISYRDPSPDEAFNVFDTLADWLRQEVHTADEQKIEQARIGVARSLVNPGNGLVGLSDAKANIGTWRPVQQRERSLAELETIGWDDLLKVADLIDPKLNSYQDITVGPSAPKPILNTKNKPKLS